MHPVVRRAGRPPARQAPGMPDPGSSVPAELDRSPTSRTAAASYAGARRSTGGRGGGPPRAADAVVLGVGGEPGDAHRPAAVAALLRRRHGRQWAVPGHRRARSRRCSAATATSTATSARCCRPPSRPQKVEQLRPAARAIAERLADGIEAIGRRLRVRGRASPSRCRRRCSPSCSACRWRTATGWRGGRPPSPAPSRCRWDRRTSRWSRAAAEMRAYGHERIAASRAAPGDDLVTRLVEAEVDGHRLSDDDVIAMITGFVFAGAETTRRQLTAAVTAPRRAPGRLGAPGRRPRPAARRRSTRSSGTARSCSGPHPPRRGALRPRGPRRAPGGRLLLSFTTANRDPARFERPRRVRGRPPRRPRPRDLRVGPAPVRRRRPRPPRAGRGARRAHRRFAPPVVEESGPTGGLGAPDWLRAHFPRR